MKNIRIGRPQKHILVLDTNIIWYDDKSKIVNPEFEQFWLEHQNIVPIKLIIPYVVKGELLYLIEKSALKCLDNIEINLDRLSSITNRKFPKRIKRDALKQSIEQKFNKWLTSKNGLIEPIPYQNIDWNLLCDKAIWRKLPFIEDSKEKDNEKGFRDQLIYETVSHIYKGKENDAILLFISNDKILKEFIDKQFDKKNNYQSFENINEFTSYLKLTREKFTTEFIKSISIKAKRKFYKRDDANCLYYKENLKLKIQEEFSYAINNPSENIKNVLATLLNKSDGLKWKVLGSGFWWISSTVFNKLEEDNIYHWQSEIIYVCAYKKIDASIEVASILDILTDKHALIINFQVHWHSKVTSNGRFMEIKYDKTILDKKSFRYPTPEEIDRYKIDFSESNTTSDQK